MLKRVFRGCLIAAAVVGFILTGSTGCTSANPTPATSQASDPDNSAVFVDGFHWSGVPNSIADPLRHCGNDSNTGNPSILIPCLKQAWEVRLEDGHPRVDYHPEGYAAAYFPESQRLGVRTGTDQVFLVIVFKDGKWTVVNHASETPYSVMLEWPSDKAATVVVTTWDPTDKYNQSVNRRGHDVPFAWSDVIPQVLKPRK